MPSLVYITQTQEEETMLSQQINDIELNSDRNYTEFMSPTTKTPLPLLTKSSPPTPPGTPSKYLPDDIGSTFATVSAVTRPIVIQCDRYRAQSFFEILKQKDPTYLLVMATGLIHPKTGFPFVYDEEPFISYQKKNDIKVGNIHLRGEVVRRARLNPNFIGYNRGNGDPPKTASWPRNKCEEWLWNNPINIDEDCQYIVDAVLKLFESVSFSNEEYRHVGKDPQNELQFQPDNETLNDLQFRPSTPVSSSLQTPMNTPFLVKPASTSLFQVPKRSTNTNHSRNKVSGSSKRTGLMDIGTFKLVLEHQKEYSIQDKTICSHDPIMNAQKKEWSTFWNKTTKIARKKKKNVKYVWEKKAAAVQKSKVDFLDQIHDLNTPMSY